MSKPHWKNASPIVRAKIEAEFAAQTSPAHAWKHAADLAWSYGFDVDPPTTPASDKIAALREAKDFRELNRLYLLSGLDQIAEQEQRNIVRFRAMDRWRSAPSDAERQAEALKLATERAREAEIEARALAIVAEQNRASLDRARAQARKELAK